MNNFPNFFIANAIQMQYASDTMKNETNNRSEAVTAGRDTWSATYAVEERYNDFVNIRNQAGQLIAVATSGPRARLITAAPDLLKACQEFVVNYSLSGVGAADLDRIFRLSEAAIAKAEGRAS